MATWAEVRDHIASRYPLEVDKPSEVAITVSRGRGPGARAQRVLARRYEAWGHEMVEIRSAFGEEGDYDPVGLLADNLQLPLGAVASHGRFLVLVHKACLEHLQSQGVLYLMEQLSLVADVLEEQAGNDRF